MINKTLKLFRIIVVTLVCIVAFSSVSNVLARDPDDPRFQSGGGSSSSDTMTFNEISSNNTIRDGATDTTGTASAAQRILQAILTIAQVIGVGVAVIMLIVLAIKYISAAPSDKAEIKKHMVVYIVGAVVLFAASGILEIIKRFAIMVDVA